VDFLSIISFGYVCVKLTWKVGRSDHGDAHVYLFTYLRVCVLFKFNCKSLLVLEYKITNDCFKLA